MATVTVGLLIILNLYVYNIYLAIEAPSIMIAMMVFFVSAISLGLSKFIYNFTNKWALILISAWVGIIFTSGILTLLKVPSATFYIIGAVFGTVFGINTGLKYYDMIPSFCASIVGAFFIIKGV